MSIINKLKELIDLFQTTNYKSFLKILIKEFNIKSEDEIEDAYFNNKNKWNKLIHCNIFCTENYLSEIIIKNRDFLDSYNDKVKDYIEFSLLANPIYLYDEWENAKFKIEDFDIDDMLSTIKLLNYPPLPLIRNYFDDEHFKDKDHMLNKLFN